MSPLVSDHATFEPERDHARAPEPRDRAPRRRPWGAVAMALVVYLILRGFVFDSVRVASSSMENTLRVGDRLLASTFAYGTAIPLVGAKLPGITSPQRGDVVLFRHPDRPREVFIKRCTAVAGDTVRVEEAVSVVPDGMIYVLGDNRDASWDSRDWGFLPLEQVVGRAEFVVWSRGRDGVRWRRIGQGMSAVGDER